MTFEETGSSGSNASRSPRRRWGSPRRHVARWTSISGGDRGLRRDLQARGMGYVLAVACNHHNITSPPLGRAGPTTSPPRSAAGPGTATALATARRAPGSTTAAWVTSTPPADEQTGHQWLPVRRNTTDGELAFYRCWSPQPVSLP